jgi:hypothetical protein
MRQRGQRGEPVTRMLAETVKDLSRGDSGFTPQASLSVGCMTVVAQPVPVRDRHLLRRQLADESTWWRWLEEHMTATAGRARREAALHPDLGYVLVFTWSPFRGQWGSGCTTTGVERHSTGTGYEADVPRRGVFQLDESGGVRVSQNYIIHPPAAADRRVLAWGSLISGAPWTLALLDGILAEGGYRTDVAIGVHVDLMNTVPEEPADGVTGIARRIRESERQPYAGSDYEETSLVSLAELAGDLRGPLDRLFGQLLRAMGLGDLLAPPAR